MKAFYFLFLALSITTWPVIYFSHNTYRASMRFVENQQNKKLQEDFKIANDPSVRKIIIEYHATEAGKGLVTVYFSEGKLLGRKQVNVNKGVNVWEYYFPSTATGVFFVKLSTKSAIRTAKVQKKVRQVWAIINLLLRKWLS